MKYPPELQHPHQLQDYFTSASELGYPEGCSSTLFFFKPGFNYTTLPCSVPVLLPDDVLQSTQTKWSTMTERPKAFGLICICSIPASWKGKQRRQAFLSSVQMTAAAFSTLSVRSRSLHDSPGGRNIYGLINKFICLLSVFQRLESSYQTVSGLPVAMEIGVYLPAVVFCRGTPERGGEDSCQLTALQKAALVLGSAALCGSAVLACSCRGCCLLLGCLPHIALGAETQFVVLFCQNELGGRSKNPALSTFVPSGPRCFPQNQGRIV